MTTWSTILWPELKKVIEPDPLDLVDCLALPGLVEFAENFDFGEDKIIKYLENELSSFDLKQYGTRVKLVATTRTLFLSSVHLFIAGFTAGSIPIIGKSKFLRRSSIAMLVAVLHAITRALIF